MTDQVAALGDVEFAAMAVQDVQRAVTPVQAGALRDPVNVDRWLCSLTQILTGLEVQFENRAVDQSPEAEAWRRRSTAFRAAVLERIGEASGVVREIRIAEAAEPAGRAGVGESVAELRVLAEQQAVKRLASAYGSQFNALLIEEYKALGLAVPRRLSRRQARDAAVTVSVSW
ncbi:hypothetical protein ACIRPK_23880 [Kitasatospora sp. NPDC101801]|uniref:hypothetical protein n=1 Tax=Kitasatospora sp. NPDC101801 TaxID=3364103 RepID=UPI00381299AB